MAITRGKREPACGFSGSRVLQALSETLTSRPLAHAGITPDLVMIGEALAGGFYPVCAVLASKG
jgi:hypothetical protein